jgi:hypothetical protein
MVTDRQKERFAQALQYVTNDGTVATFRPIDVERIRFQYGHLVRKGEAAAFLEWLVEQDVCAWVIARTKTIFEEIDSENNKKHKRKEAEPWQKS